MIGNGWAGLYLRLGMVGLGSTCDREWLGWALPEAGNGWVGLYLRKGMDGLGST